MDAPGPEVALESLGGQVLPKSKGESRDDVIGRHLEAVLHSFFPVSTALRMATIWRLPSSAPASFRRTRSMAAGTVRGEEPGVAS
jgi:hypothetical protein